MKLTMCSMVKNPFKIAPSYLQKKRPHEGPNNKSRIGINCDSGSSRKYLYSKGKFTVTPKTNLNTAVQSDGTLLMTRTSQLVLPFTDSTKTVMIKIMFGAITGNAGVYQPGITRNGESNKRLLANPQVASGTELVLGCNGCTSSFAFDAYWADNNYYNQNMYVEEIWYE
jgi:hypothetical protein